MSLMICTIISSLMITSKVFISVHGLNYGSNYFEWILIVEAILQPFSLVQVLLPQRYILVVGL